MIDLGAFLLIGVGLSFVVLWGIDRSRLHTLCFAGTIAFCFAANVALVFGLLLMFTTTRLLARARHRLTDRIAVAATLVLSGALLLNVVLALFSRLPHEITSDAAIDVFAGSLAVVGITVASALVLPAAMVGLLAASAADLVADLRFERDRDELTGLLNRPGFTEGAGLTLRNASSCALILADLDFFKTVNDALGHAGGDEALKAFVAVLRTAPEV
nr:diguanylate cyclase [Mycolicibacterium psychrotolerans]